MVWCGECGECGVVLCVGLYLANSISTCTFFLTPSPSHPHILTPSHPHILTTTEALDIISEAADRTNDRIKELVCGVCGVWVCGVCGVHGGAWVCMCGVCMCGGVW